MTKLPFDQWAPVEIRRLRQEADALQRAFDLYTAGATDRAASLPKLRAIEGGRQRTSKYEAAFVAFEEANRVLSINDMIEIAKACGFEMDRSNMRSQVFAQKKAGRAHPQGDGYLWGLSKIETAPSNKEDAA